MFLLHRIVETNREGPDLSDHVAKKSMRKLRGWLIGMLMIAGIFGLAYYWGRPMEPRYFEVDVTDKIAEIAQSGVAGAARSSESEGARP